MKREQLFSFVLLLLIFSGCRKEGCTKEHAYNYDADARKDGGTCRFKPRAGEEYGGGICYYIQQIIDASDRYYIVAPEDVSVGAQWGCSGTSISYSSSMLTAGLNNTVCIYNECSESGIAGRLCWEYNSGPHSDWNLPSETELKSLYSGSATINGIIDGAYYWSSTQISSTHAIAVVFSGTSATSVTLPKSTLCRVRPAKMVNLD